MPLNSFNNHVTRIFRDASNEENVLLCPQGILAVKVIDFSENYHAMRDQVEFSQEVLVVNLCFGDLYK
jgi:hypothetical protein